HGCPAGFLASIDVAHILGIGNDPPLGLDQKLFSASRDRRPGRTSFHTCWLSTFGLALRAHVALLDVWHQLGPLVTRHAEWARHQTVPAPDAFRGLIRHRSCRSLLQRSYQARRS